MVKSKTDEPNTADKTEEPNVDDKSDAPGTKKDAGENSGARYECIYKNLLRDIR